MTLVVALITAEFALLATDRRVTTRERDNREPSGWRTTSQVDSDTKTTMLAGTHVLGFAGLARRRVAAIDAVTGRPMRQRLESWIVSTLQPRQPAEYFNAIADEFGSVCEEQGYLGDHAFLAVGWRTTAFGLVPELVRIDNRTAPFTFHPYRHTFGGEPFLLDFAGMPPPPDMATQLRGQVERLVSAREWDPRSYIPHVQRLFQQTAAASNGDVGAACLVTTIPRRAVPMPPGLTFHADVPPPEVFLRESVSVFLPDPALGEPGLRFQPASVGPSLAILGAVVAFGPQAKQPGPLDGVPAT